MPAPWRARSTRTWCWRARDATDPVIAAFQTLVPGGACVTTTPLSPGHRNEFHAGIPAGVREVSSWWMRSTSGSTPTRLSTSACSATRRSLIPIEWASSKIPGYAIRGTMPNFHGLSAYIVMSSVAARFFGPQVAGIGATPGGDQRIPHRPRREVQPEHAPAIPAVEKDPVDQLRLAL